MDEPNTSIEYTYQENDIQTFREQYEEPQVQLQRNDYKRSYDGDYDDEEEDYDKEEALYFTAGDLYAKGGSSRVGASSYSTRRTTSKQSTPVAAPTGLYAIGVDCEPGT